MTDDVERRNTTDEQSEGDSEQSGADSEQSEADDGRTSADSERTQRGDDRARRDGGTTATGEPSFGDAWVYESIVTALPGANLAGGPAIALQLGVFTGAILIVAAAYDVWNAVVPGMAAVVVAAVGSYLMLQFGDASRTAAAPPRYYQLLYGSSIEVVLAVLAFIALLTHLFVYEPQFVGEPSPLAVLLPPGVVAADEPLVEVLFGEEPPVAAVYLTMLVLWDLCYRIGTSWWAAVVSLYREIRLVRGAGAAATFRRLDVLNVGFAATQVVMLPFLLDRPVLLVAVAGHIVAVAVVSGAALTLSLYNGEVATT